MSSQVHNPKPRQTHAGVGPLTTAQLQYDPEVAAAPSLTSTSQIASTSACMLQPSSTDTLLQQQPSWRFTTTLLEPLVPGACADTADGGLLVPLLPPLPLEVLLQLGCCATAGNGMEVSCRCCSRAWMLSSVLSASTISGCIRLLALPGWPHRYTRTGWASCGCMYTITCVHGRQEVSVMCVSTLC